MKKPLPPGEDAPPTSPDELSQAGRVTDDLRRRAESYLDQLGPRRNLPEFSDLATLLEELAVHQVELDMQGQELARSHDDLSAANQLYQRYFRHAPVPIMRLDEGGLVLEANLPAFDLLGPLPSRSPHSLQRALFSLIPITYRNVWRQFLAKILTSSDAQITEIALVWPDGQERFFSLTGLSIPEKQSILYFQDITATRENTRLVERLSLIASQTSSLVIFTDCDRRITWVNDAFCQRTGYTRPEVLGRTPAMLQGSGTNRETIDLMTRHLDRREKFQTEVLNYTKEGSAYWVHLEVQPQIDSTGETVGFFALQTDITEMRTRETELDAFRTAIEQSPSTVVMTDLDGGITYVNPAFTQTSGYSREEVLGKNPRILNSHSQSPQFYEQLWQEITSGKNWQGIFHNRRKDGSTYWEFATIAPILGDTGKPIGFIAVKQDITREKEAELRLEKINHSLEETRRHLEQTNALALVGSWEVNKNSGLMELTSIARRIHDIDDECQLTLEESYEFYPKGIHRDRIRRAFEEAISRGIPFDEEAEFLSARGNQRFIRIVGLSEFDEQSQCLRLYGSIQDITAHKELQIQLENALEKERRQLRFIEDLTAAVPVAIFQRNLNGDIVDANPAAAILTGYSHEQLLQLSTRDRDGDEIAQEVAEEDLLLIYGKESLIRRERNIIHRSGHKVPVLLSKAPVHDARGRIIGIVSALVDATETKKLESDLRKAKIEAEAANRAKSSFLATMSHEIRTPLNAVIGMASLLSESDLSSDQHDYASTIVNASETLLDLISDILDYSKIESEKLQLHYEPFTFEDAVIDPIELFARTAAEKDIELTHYIDPDIPLHLVGDRARIKQILINLLANAIKFTPQGQVCLTVDLLEAIGEDHIIQFRLSDTGIGISPEALSRLFQPFNQADSSITRQFGGTGLGLAITRQLVRLMSGNISVESEEEHGSTFTFTIRLRLPDADFQPPSPADPAKLLHDRRLLVVDDVLVNRSLIQAFGRLWGMEIETAAGAAEGRLILEQKAPFDFIICDYQMPKQDGISFMREAVDAKKTGSSLRILLSSVKEYREEVPDGLFHKILLKPIRPSRLCEILANLLSQPTAPTAVDTTALSQLRVLVAEDNPNNRMVMQLMLKKLNIHPILCENGAEAVELVQNSGDQPFHICIIDMQMPVMDGLTAVRHLCEFFQANPDLPRPYLLALTANAFREDEASCLEAGFDRYLSKPVTLVQLREVLSSLTPLASTESISS